MKNRIFCIISLVFIIFLYGFVAHPEKEKKSERVSIGAIRWDAWFKDSINPYEKNLADKKWHGRLPFYAKILSDSTVEIRGDNQEAIDQEIAYAKKGGLDYWAFLYYQPSIRDDGFNHDYMNRARRLYLSSKHKKDINFCLIVYPKHGNLILDPRDPGCKTINEWISMMLESNYQKVAGNRPLLYLMFWGPEGTIRNVFGSVEKGRAWLDALRERIMKAGLKNPYFVTLSQKPEEGAAVASDGGLDAISSYTSWGGPDYRGLSANHIKHWDAMKATLKKVVPNLSAGWGGPRDGRGDVLQPKPQEINSHVRSAFNWIEANPEAAEAKTMLWYAWNEMDEGGWLVPDKKLGTAKLDEIREVVNERKMQGAEIKLNVNPGKLNDTFDQQFLNPPNQFRIIQYHMNKDIDENETERLKSYGIGGIQQSVAWNKKYLEDEEAWQKLATDIQKAKNAGLQVWIHDEKGYPSGAAGGLVVRDHPEFENTGLVRIVRQGLGKKKTQFELPDSIEFFRATICPVMNGETVLKLSKEITFGKGIVKTEGMEGSWQISVFGLKILDKDTQAQSTITQFGQTGHYPNLLNKDANQRFINLTHQAYANNIQNINRKVDVFYTGEPNLMTTYWKYDGSNARNVYIPWEIKLPVQFKKQHGYDLIPFLDAMFEGNTAETKIVRLHFYQTIAEMFTSNYVKPITEWCEKNGVRSLGHLLLEEYMALHVIYYGNMMKALRNFNIPACDIPIPKNDSVTWEFWMPKFISSAAYLENKPMVTALLDPIIGGNGRNNLSPEMNRLKKTVNMAYLCGVNQISTYIPYEKYSATDYYQFNQYIGRLSVMLRGAKNEASIAMYYPIETFQANYVVSPEPWNKIIRKYEYLQKILDRMASGMLKNGLDFNYLTADAILNGKIKNGYLEVGSHCYYSIVMPHVEVIPLKVLKKLVECSKAGVNILWVDAIPSLGISNYEHQQIKKLASSFRLNEQPLDELKMIKNHNFKVDIESDNSKITIGKYSRDKNRIYFIVNDSGKDINVDMKSEKCNIVKIYNPVDGNIMEEKLPLKKKIGRYESLFVLEK
jgi:hypothetical protein